MDTTGAGDCFVASPEVFPVRSTAQRSCDLDRGGSVVRGSGALGVLGAGATGGEGRSAGSVTIRVNRGSLDHEGAHVLYPNHGKTEVDFT